MQHSEDLANAGCLGAVVVVVQAALRAALRAFPWRGGSATKEESPRRFAWRHRPAGCEHPCRCAAPPRGCAENPGGGLRALSVVGDHEHTPRAGPMGEATEGLGPEGLGLAAAADSPCRASPTGAARLRRPLRCAEACPPPARSPRARDTAQSRSASDRGSGGCLASSSPDGREIWVLEMPGIGIACTMSSTGPGAAPGW